MKFKTKKSELVKALQIVENAVAIKATMPVLMQVLLNLNGNTLQLSTTNLNLSITTNIVVAVQEEGALTLPFKRFKDVVSALSNEEIEITTDQHNSIIINNNNCKLKIKSLSADDFPKLPDIKTENTFKIKYSLLSEMVMRTAFAASLDEARAIFTGILLEVEQDNIILAATDSKRIAVSKNKLSTSINTHLKAIVPAKTFKEIVTMLQGEGDLLITMEERMIGVIFGPTKITSRVINGEYPDYSKVIPSSNENKLTVSRKNLLEALKRSALFMTEEYQSTKFDFTQNKLTISKITPDVGEFQEEINITYAGGDIVIGFYPNYLIDALSNLTEEVIECELTAADRPAVIKVADYTYIVLPMRLH